MRLHLLSFCTALLTTVGCGKERATDSRSLLNAPSITSAAVPIASSKPPGDAPQPTNPPIHIHRPNDTYHLPSPDWNEQMDHDQILGSWGDWATRYAGELFGKVQTGTWVTDVRAFVEFFNAPQMDWFIDTPNVNSYDQQMEIRARFLGKRHNYHIEICGPGWTSPVKWDAGGVTAIFERQSETWLEPMPTSWAKCVPAKPYSENILNNGLGEPSIAFGTETDLVVHVSRNGKVNSFRMVPSTPTLYTVTKTTKCWFDPGDRGSSQDSFVPFKPSMSAPSNGQGFTCRDSGPYRSVTVNGTPCYLDDALVRKARKQLYKETKYDPKVDPGKVPQFL